MRICGLPYACMRGQCCMRHCSKTRHAAAPSRLSGYLGTSIFCSTRRRGASSPEQALGAALSWLVYYTRLVYRSNPARATQRARHARCPCTGVTWPRPTYTYGARRYKQVLGDKTRPSHNAKRLAMAPGTPRDAHLYAYINVPTLGISFIYYT